MLFSERIGAKEPKMLQIDDVDMDLRTRLWNAILIYYWTPLKISWTEPEESLNQLIQCLWIKYFKQSIDELPRNGFCGHRKWLV